MLYNDHSVIYMYTDKIFTVWYTQEPGKTWQFPVNCLGCSLPSLATMIGWKKIVAFYLQKNILR